MFIQTEKTPNTETLKFIPGMELFVPDVIHFDRDKDCKSSPLVQELFKIEGVKSVLLTNSFLSITKENKYTWEVLKTFILSALIDYFISGQQVFISSSKKLSSSKKRKKSNAIITQIQELIETKVRPAVMQDGGDVIFRDFKDGIVFLKLQGACAGCPSATITLKHGIEGMLKHYIPEVKSVEQV